MSQLTPPRANAGSLRFRLLLLILLAVLPASALLVYTSVERERQAEARAEAGLLQTARLIALSHQQRIEATRDLLAALARMPEVQALESEACHQRLAALHPLYPQYAGLAVADLNGDNVCAGSTITSTVNIADRLYFQRVVQSADFAVGEYQIGRSTGRPVLAFGYPVFDAQGRLGGVIFTTVALATLNRTVGSTPLPEGAVLTIVDGNGIIMVREPNAEQWMGQPLPEAELAAAIAAGGAGVFTAQAPPGGPSGGPHLYAYAPIGGMPNVDLYVSISLPLAVAHAEANQLLARNLLWAGLVAVLVLATAWAWTRLSILRPVNVLAATAQRLRRGDLSARTGLPPGGDELSRLAGTFDEMAGALAAREAALAAERERLRVTLAGIGDAVITTDAQGRVTFVNAVAQALTGWPQADAAGRPIEEVFRIINEQTRATVESPVAHVLREGVIVGLANHTLLLTRDGREVPVDDSGAPIRDERGQLLGVVLVFRDVTARRQAEAALLAAKSQAEAAAQRAASLAQITAGLAQATTPAQVAEVAITEGAALLGTASGALFLLTPNGAGLELAASTRLPEGVADYHGVSLRSASANGSVAAAGEAAARSPLAEAVRRGDALWFADNAALARDYAALAAARAAAGLQALAVLPVSASDRPLGAMTFSYAEARNFSPDEQAFLLAVANQCGQALERASAYAAERLARAEAETARKHLSLLSEASAQLAASLDLDATLRLIVRLLLPQWGDYCGIYLMDDDGSLRSAGHGHVDPQREPLLAELNALYPQTVGDDNNLLGRVLRTGQTVHVAVRRELRDPTPAHQQRLWQVVDALAPAEVLGVPLVAHGRVLGALMLAVAESGRGYTSAEVGVLEELARRAALALENASLYDQAQRLNAELEQRVEARTRELVQSEARFHLLVDSVHDYAIFMLDPTGRIASWNTGAARIKGYAAGDIIGRHFSTFYPPEDAQRGVPQRALAEAERTGHWEAEGWRVRQDGTRFWASVVITPVRGAQGELLGFAKVTRDLTERKVMEDELRASRERLMEEVAARRRAQQQLEQSREIERARIAREVHDELGGALTSLKMGLHRLRKQPALPPALQAQVGQLGADVDATAQVVRRIAHDLRPAVLDDFGLVAALEWHFSEFEKRTGLAGEWVCEVEEVSLTSEAAIACYRIFQEALTNIVRHAQASRVRVSLRLEGGGLLLEVVDNGRGLPPGELPPGHLGLVGMRERAALLAGQLDIASVPGQGTTVTLRVPVAP